MESERDKLTVIENTNEARTEYADNYAPYGEDCIELTKEHITLLLQGKCIAHDNGEYSQFVYLK